MNLIKPKSTLSKESSKKRHGLPNPYYTINANSSIKKLIEVETTLEELKLKRSINKNDKERKSIARDIITFANEAKSLRELINTIISNRLIAKSRHGDIDVRIRT